MIYSRNFKGLSLLLGSIIVLSSLVYNLQVHIDTSIPQPPRFEDLKYLPSGKFLKGAALSYDEVLSDLLWIKAVGYFGGHAVSDQNYEWLHHILDIITTLDPHFEDPYEFGGVVLATETGDVEKSISILKKGMENVPKDHWRYWYLPFFLAFDYMYYKGDILTAAHYLEKAATFPGSPEYLPLLVARLYSKADNSDIAIVFLREILKNARSPELKEKLRKRIKEVMVMRDLRALEAARDQFFARWARYPSDLKELVDSREIHAIPKEPFGGRYYIDLTDHSIHSTSLSKRLKLHINKKGQGPTISIEEK